ncbi:Uncharacterised protein [Shigella sonnei]|nr:Uncharacterised protein [Shigella sonnei]
MLSAKEVHGYDELHLEHRHPRTPSAHEAEKSDIGS